MGVLSSREAVEDYIHGDPFFVNGMICKWYVREWANMFACSTVHEPRKLYFI